jgi:serine protease Do
VSVDESRRNAIVEAIERVSPAVVSVNVVQVQAERVGDPFSRDFWDFFYAPAPRYRLRERQLNSIGSGFIIDNRGHIVTNYHVVENAEKVASVTLTDGREVEVELVGGDERTDLAVLRAKGSGLPYATLGDSSGVMIGEWAIAIGNPFGVLMKDPNPSVSVGVISANHRRISPSIAKGERLYQDMIQTDAAINPGNSGGPLVNANGEVIGVNTMIFSTSGANVGLGFALPINRVRRIADEIVKYGRRRDPWPGFKVEDITALRRDLREQLGLRVEEGGIVVNILTTAPAYAAGLQPGDAILKINGEPVRSSSDVDFAIWDLFVGDPVELEVDRQGARHVVKFAIQELSE